MASGYRLASLLRNSLCKHRMLKLHCDHQTRALSTELTSWDEEKGHVLENLTLPDNLLQDDSDPLARHSLLADFEGPLRTISRDKVNPQLVEEVISRQKFGQNALTIFKWAAEQEGYTHTPASYVMLIKKLCAAKMFVSVWHVLEDMRNNHLQLIPDIFEIIIQGYCNAGQVKPAIDTLMKMIDFECSATMEHYLYLIEYVVRVKRPRVALLLYKRMRGEGLKANKEIFTAIINGFCNSGEATVACEFFDEMINMGCSPDEDIYNCLIQSLSRVGNCAHAHRLLVEMIAKCHKPSVAAYNALIDALCKDQRFVTAYKLFQSMHSSGCQPDIDTYNMLIDALCQQSAVYRAIKLYKSMPREGVDPNSETDKILLIGLTKADKVDRAIRMLDTFIESGRQIDPVGCNAILHALCTRSMAKAEAFFQKMEKQICTPDTYSYTSLMFGYCRNGWIREAERVFWEMKAKGCKPSAVTYEGLICLYCKNQELEAASNLFDVLMKEGSYMNRNVCNALLDGLSKAGLVDHALKLIDYVMDNKIVVNADRLVTFLKTLKKVGKGVDSKKLLKEMARKGCLQEPYASMF